MTAPVPALAPKTVETYAKFARGVSFALECGKLGIDKVKLIVSVHHELIKKHDAELYPVAVVAIAITLLWVDFLPSIAFFTLGTLYAIAKGDKWKEGIITNLTDVWDSSTLGKVGLIAAAILLVAPMKWQLAAFGFGIHCALALKKV